MANTKRLLRRSLTLWILGVVLLSGLGVILGYGIRPKRPVLFFPQGQVWDFGTVEDGKPVTHKFLFANRGSIPLRIERLKTGCSCTSVTTSRNELAPGEDAVVEMRYDHGQDTTVTSEAFARAIIFTNDPKNPAASVEMQGQVLTAVAWAPLSVSFFGNEGSTGLTKEVAMWTGRPEELRV